MADIYTIINRISHRKCLYISASILIDPRKNIRGQKKSGNKQNSTSLFQRMIFPSNGLCRKKKASTRKIRRSKQTQENGLKQNSLPIINYISTDVQMALV